MPRHVVGAPWSLIGSTGTTTTPIEPCDPRLAFARITGEYDLGQVSWARLSPPTDEQFGWDVAGLGDANGDGLGDLAVVAPDRISGGNDGGVDLIPSPLAPGGSDPNLAGVRVLDASPTLGCCWLPDSEHSMRALPDQTGDGLPEVVLANPYGPDSFSFNYGIVYVLASPIGASATISDLDAAWATFTWNGGGTEQIAFGDATAIGDLTGDGVTDLLIAVSRAKTDLGAYTGRGYLFSGPLSPGAWTEADAVVQVMPASDPVAPGVVRIPAAAGYQAIAQDLNGDGVAELALTAPISSKEHILDEAGGVWIWEGPLLADVLDSDAAAVLWGNQPYEELGNIADALGDTDGDGYGEIGLSSTGGPYPGGLGYSWIVNGLPVGTEDVGAVAVTNVHGVIDLDSAAFVHGLGDVDRDGFDDIAVGALAINGDNRGGTALFYGPLAQGDVAVDQADAILWGEGGGDAPVRATNAGDMDGDCIPELAVGAPSNNTVYVLSAGL